MKIGLLLIFGLLLAALLAFYAVCIEPMQLRIKNWTVTSSGWKDQPPLKIALVADLHAAWPWMTPKRIEKIVEETNSLKPDIILLLGDYVATHHFMKAIPAADALQPLKKLQAKCGVYGILGNHDLDPRIIPWREEFIKTGIPLFEDDAKKISCNGRSFWLVGLKDQWFKKPDLSEALSKTDRSFPTILMMHEPDLFPDVPEHIALTVAGHTHGGQVRLPFIGAVFVPSKYGTRYAYGHITEGQGKNLVVSGGLGNSILPIRFLMPPEITVIELKSP